MLEPTTPTDSAAEPHPPADTPPPGEKPVVVVGTPEWDELTARRATLIRKEVRGGGLTDAERAELDRLDAISLAATAVAFPAPAWIERLDAIELRLASSGGSPEQ